MKNVRTADQFHLLFVCTANVCRSPIAEEFARLKIHASGWPDAGLIKVGSAGIRAREGAAMDPNVVIMLRELGVEPTTGFSSRVLTTTLMADADLVLTAQRLHRAASVALHPRSNGKVFTILEFARLAGQADMRRLPAEGVVSRARALVREVARLRGLAPADPADDDVADPHGGPAGEYRRCAATIEAALERSLQPVLAG